MTIARIALLLAVPALAASLSGCGDPSGREVWFTPNLGTADLLDLFERPEAWSQARSQIDVFEFHQANVLWQSPEQCPSCGPNLYPALVRSGAFSRLGEWGLALSMAGASIKEWDCEGTVNTSLALASLRNVSAAGSSARYFSMDEPLLSGRACAQTSEQTARRTAAFMRSVQAEFPGVSIGDVEPYPILNVVELQYWLLKLKGEGALPAFFHLDVDRTAFVHHPEAEVTRDLRLMRDFCETLGLPFGVMFASLEGASDKAYYDDVMSWIDTVQGAVGMPRHAVFISWVETEGARRVVPINLPESDTSVYSHTRLVNDALAVLRPKS